MTEQEQKVFLDGMFEIMTEVKNYYTSKKTEAMEQALKFEEERKRYSIQERTIQDLIFTIKQEMKKLENKKGND